MKNSAASKFKLPEMNLPGRAAKKPKVDEEKTHQLTSLARLAERRDDPRSAERAYREIMTEDPKNPLPYHRLAIMRAKQSLFDEAETLFSKAHELNPTDPTLLSDMGYFHYLASNNKKAEEYLRSALKYDSANEICCNNLGILLGEQGRYEEARTFFSAQL